MKQSQPVREKIQENKLEITTQTIRWKFCFCVRIQICDPLKKYNLKIIYFLLCFTLIFNKYLNVEEKVY